MQNRFLSSFVLSFLKKRFLELVGLGLLLVGLGIGLSLATYNQMDPSLNTSSLSLPTNILDVTGSVVSDLLFQCFGLASFFWIFVIGIWGFHLLNNRSEKFTLLRMFSAFIGIILIGILFTPFPVDKLWLPIPSHILTIPQTGGAFGFLGYEALYGFLQAKKLSFLIVPSGIAVALFSFSFIWYAFGFSLEQLKRCIYSIYHLVVFLCVSIGKLIYVLFAKKKYQPLNVFSDFPENSEIALERNQVFYESLDDIPNIDWDYINHEDEHSNIDLPNEIKQVSKKEKTKSKDFVFPDHMLQSGEYTLPPLDLLDKTVQKSQIISQDILNDQARLLESVLNEFGIRGDIVNIRPGPVVTLYELKPAPGIKTSRVISLSDDIARSMSALSARIAVIPGQNAIGIELPNRKRQTVYLRELLCTSDYNTTETALPLILGQDIGGHPVIADLAKMPHLLVAGTTGSGKSVSVNAMILSLLFKLPPTRCKFIMIDPKMLELSVYDDIPHLLTPVVTDPKKAVVALKEMEKRYRSMSKLGVRNIEGFNNRLQEAKKSGELLVRRVQTGFDPDTGKPIFENQDLDYETLPYIVVVVDEMADLMLVAGKEIEATIQRLAQMARAAGIHLIMATQRPSVDVITGTIKANFPTRISFQVTSKIDSRTILSEQGAEQLLGQGDMLHMAGGGRISRVHGPYVRDDEVERIVSFLKFQGEPSYVDGITDDDEDVASPFENSGNEGDKIYNQAVEIIMREQKVSTSFIQRHLQIGYNRAARIVEQMEKEGLISPPNHAGKRQILR